MISAMSLVCGTFVNGIKSYPVPEHGNHVNYSKIKQYSTKNTISGLSLKFVIKGTENYHINNKFHRVENDEFLLVNNNNQYELQIDSKSPVEGICFYYNNGLVQQCFDLVSKNFDNILNNQSQRETFPFIEWKYKTGEFGLQNCIRSISENVKEGETVFCPPMMFYQVLESIVTSQIIINKRLYKLKSVKQNTKIELYKRIQDAKHYILDNFDKKIKIKEISGIACLSEYHFIRIFAQMTGYTPHQFLNNYRIKKAKQYMENKKHDLFSVAVLSGFDSPETFRKCFKRIAGIAPSEF